MKPAVQRINLATSVTENFVGRFMLTDELFEKAMLFWKEFMNMNLSVIKASRPTPKENSDGALVGSFTAEGGSYWTLRFETYKKIINVYFCCMDNYTYSQVQVQLPGAYNLNANDIEQVAYLVKSFHEYLESLGRGD